MTMTHHAWLCEASSIPAALETLLKKRDTEVLLLEESVLRIDTVRQLIATAHTTSLSHPTRTCVVVTQELTHESQNALLKLFEEPPAHTSFYLVVPNAAGLIPTLRSRLQHYAHLDEGVDTHEWQSFCVLPIAEQLAMVNDKTKSKDIAWQQAIMTGAALDTTVSKQISLLLDTYLGTRGASAKMLLEALVLSSYDGQKPAGALQ